MLYVCSHLIIAGSLFRCGSQSFKQAKCECTRASKLTLTKSVSVCIHLQSQCVNYTFLGALIVILVCSFLFHISIYKVWSFQSKRSWEGYFLARLCFLSLNLVRIYELWNSAILYWHIFRSFIFNFLGLRVKIRLTYGLWQVSRSCWISRVF